MDFFISVLFFFVVWLRCRFVLFVSVLCFVCVVLSSFFGFGRVFFFYCLGYGNVTVVCWLVGGCLLLLLCFVWGCVVVLFVV